MKWLVAALVAVLALLQYRLWVGEGSVAEVVRLKQQIEEQKTEIERLRERNRILALEVRELKEGLDLIEERARQDMGLVREDETFYMIVDEDEGSDSSGDAPPRAEQ